jgi:hypothetical protein
MTSLASRHTISTRIVFGLMGLGTTSLYSSIHIATWLKACTGRGPNAKLLIRSTGELAESCGNSRVQQAFRPCRIMTMEAQPMDASRLGQSLSRHIMSHRKRTGSCLNTRFRRASGASGVEREGCVTGRL